MRPNDTVMRKCPMCYQYGLVQTTWDESEEFTLEEGEVIRYEVKNLPGWECLSCGEIATGSEAARLRHDAVCVASGRYTPFELERESRLLTFTKTQMASLLFMDEPLWDKHLRGRVLPSKRTCRLFGALLRLGKYNAILTYLQCLTEYGLPVPKL